MIAPYGLDLVSRAKINPPDLSQHNFTRIQIFIAFQVFGLIGSLFIILTVLLSPLVSRSGGASRHISWHAFMFSWVISATSYSLLFFSGQLNNANPPFGICSVQSGLIYAAPPLTAFAATGFVMQIWFSVVAVAKKSARRWEKPVLWITIILPYVILGGILAESMIFAFQSPRSIRRTGSGMFCNSGNPIPGRISTGLVVVAMLPTLVFEGLIAWTIKKNWATFKTRKSAVEMVARVFAFTLFGVFALALSLVFFFTIHHGSDLDIVVATLPVALVLVFGTQRDIIETWMFWRWRWWSGKDSSTSQSQQDAITWEVRIGKPRPISPSSTLSKSSISKPKPLPMADGPLLA